LYGSRGFEARVVQLRRLSASLIWAIESHGACLATKENNRKSYTVVEKY